MIIDELMTELEILDAGLPVNNEDPGYRVSAMGYADDLILMGKSTGEVNNAAKTHNFFENRHFSINARKSCAVVPVAP